MSPRRSCARRARSTCRAAVHDLAREGAAGEPAQTAYDITADGVNEFVEGIRTGKLENAAFHAAESTLTAVMALQACVQGREMTWENVWKA